MDVIRGIKALDLAVQVPFKRKIEAAIHVHLLVLKLHVPMPLLEIMKLPDVLAPKLVELLAQMADHAALLNVVNGKLHFIEFLNYFSPTDENSTHNLTHLLAVL